MTFMSTQSFPLLSRTGLELAFAGLLFSATVALIAAGAAAMTVSSAFSG
jgi:hypothetical protein